MAQKKAYIIAEVHLAAVESLIYHKTLKGLTEEVKIISDIYKRLEKGLEEGIEHLKKVGIEIFFHESNLRYYKNIGSVPSRKIDPNLLKVSAATDFISEAYELDIPQEPLHIPLLDFILEEVRKGRYNNIGLSIGKGHAYHIKNLLGKNGFQAEIIKTLYAEDAFKYSDPEFEALVRKSLRKVLWKKV